MTNLAASCLIWLLAIALPAQVVHVVGAGGLQSAIDGAAPGDILELLPGTYPHFKVDRAITIRPAVPGTVGIAFDPALEDPACLASSVCVLTMAATIGATIFAPPAGAQVHVVGIDFVPNVLLLTYPLGVHHRVRVTSGIVTFDRCTIRATDAHALGVENAQVHLQSCVVTSLGTSLTAPGILAVSSNVTAVDCAITGNSAGGLNDSGSALRLSLGSFTASHCTLTGGTSIGIGNSGSALFFSGGGSVWVRDSTLLTDGSVCAVVGNSAVALMARCTISPGGIGCGTLLPAPLIGVTRSAPLQNGATFTANLHTEPSALVAVHASPRLDHVPVPGLFAQPIGIDPSAFWLAGLYVADANGDVAAAFDLPVGLYVDEALWLQAMALLPGATFQLAPAVGGIIR